MYAYSLQNIGDSALILVTTQYYVVLISNIVILILNQFLMYFRFVNIFQHFITGNVIHKLMCRAYIPLVYNSLWRQPSAKTYFNTCYELYFILLHAFVGGCTDCKNMHGMNSIKYRAFHNVLCDYKHL